MPTPSLLIVPARFKTGRLYSQIPTANGDFTVTRNTEARRFDSAGLIESVASGIPRLDYYTSGGVTGCPALLVEPAATNICLQSEAFNTTWTRVSGGTGLLPVITANAVVAPDGTTTADTVVFDRGSATSGSANFSQLQQDINFPTSGTYTLSVYAKATASGDVGKQFYIRTRNTLVAGSLTSSWVRYTSTETGLSSGSNPVYIGNRGGFTADQSVSVDLWGAQLETGSVATSYIPTTTGTGSRSADVISVTGAVSGSIGQQSGTLYIECQSEFAVNDIIVINTAGQTPGNNYLYITKNSSNRFQVAFVATGTTVSFSETSGITSFAKIAIAYASGNTACFINGIQVGTTSTTGFSFNSALNNIRFVANLVEGAKTTRIRAVALYTTRLTNAELATLTTL